MVKKGIITSVNIDEKKARVYLSENDYISPEIPYSIEVVPNDIVIVAFYDRFYSEGIIFQNLSRDSSSEKEHLNYTHIQITPSSEWVIKHNLNKYPSISIVDSGGNIVIGDISYMDMNEARITFTTEFSGKAYLN